MTVTLVGDVSLEVTQEHAEREAWWRDPQALAFVHQDALILHQLLLGRLVLHGSAVAVGELAAVTIGPSGAGKSTTAAALMSEGSARLADDVVVIDEVDGRLCVLHSEARSKGDPMPLPGDGATRLEPVPLGLVTVLTAAPDSGDPPGWRRLHGASAFEAVWQYGGGQRGLQVFGRANYLKRIAAVAAAAPVWRLQRGSTGPTPAEVAAGIVERMSLSVGAGTTSQCSARLEASRPAPA